MPQSLLPVGGHPTPCSQLLPRISLEMPQLRGQPLCLLPRMPCPPSTSSPQGLSPRRGRPPRLPCTPTRGRGYGRPVRCPPADSTTRPARPWPTLPVRDPQSPLAAVWPTEIEISIQTWLRPPRGAVQSLSVPPRRTWPCRVECLAPTDQFPQGGPWSTLF